VFIVGRETKTEKIRARDMKRLTRIAVIEFIVGLSGVVNIGQATKPVVIWRH
jgi:hypothetical protein